MRVAIKMMGMLRGKMPAGGTLELPDGATIEDALQSLDVQLESIQVFTVNGKIERNRQRVLNDGDNLQVLPPVGGG